MRYRIPIKESDNRQSYLRSKSEIRPLFSRLTPHQAIHARSPLISLIFPPMKDKIKIFQENCKKKEMNKGNSSMFVDK
jgi:hypothetical protein